jgi:protein-disulfide isomerase
MNRMSERKAAAAMRAFIVLAVCAVAARTFAADSRDATTPSDVQSMRAEIRALRAAQAELRDEIREIKALLQKASAPPAAAAPAVGAQISLQGAQVRGDQHAQLVLVEFSDFQCPFCARHATATYPQIVRDYVDTGRLRYAFMNFPIDALHPRAFQEHVAAACAADQGRFWEMHDRLFADQKAADPEALAADAQALGLDVAVFRACIDSERHAAEIRDAVRVGNSLGVMGTPTFLIGTVQADGKLKTMQVVAGAKPYAAFREAIDAALGVTPPPIAAATAPGADTLQAGWRPVEQVRK